MAAAFVPVKAVHATHAGVRHKEHTIYLQHGHGPLHARRFFAKDEIDRTLEPALLDAQVRRK